LKRIEGRGDGDEAIRKLGELHDELDRLLITAERTRIFDLYRSGELKDEARRRIERELDMREAHLFSSRR
jgi:CPA1 family monovalent cation:H+ antiporter